MSARPKDRYRHPADHKPVTTWIPGDLLARIDAHLEAQVGDQVSKPSRQRWLLELMRRELSRSEAA